MEHIATAAAAALAITAALTTPAQADELGSLVQGSVCNLYLLKEQGTNEGFIETEATLSAAPAVVTFADTAANFIVLGKKNGVSSNWGKWTGWLKHEKGGITTFSCQQTANTGNYDEHVQHGNRYSIWINGVKYVNAAEGQVAFDVELLSGFNAVEIIVENSSNRQAPLAITYKRKGSIKDPIPFGPKDMFYAEED